MIIKTTEKLELVEKLKTSTKEEAKIIQKRIDGLDMSKCKHILVESDETCRGVYGADERWTAYECVNCGLTNKALDNSEFNSATVKEWSKLGVNSGPIISDEGFCWSYINELYNKALNNSEDEFDREEVAYLFKKYIRVAREMIIQNKELEKRKKDIEFIDVKLEELSKLPIKDLDDIKARYYIDYFNTHRKEYSLLEDIPPYEYLYKQNLKHPIGGFLEHPLKDYSFLNVILLGEFITELFKKYEKKDVESYVRFKDQKITETKTIEIPNLIIGETSGKSERNPFEDKNNIIIPLNSGYSCFEKQGDIKSIIKYPGYGERDSVVCFSPKRHLIDRDNELAGIDYKEYTFIRNLIYTLAYYQKEAGVREVDDEHLKAAFKRIYKL